MATMAKSQSHIHILPLRVYLTVAVCLFILTGLTVLVSDFHFGPYNLVVAMLIAALKGSLVVLFFMHLKYDSKVYMVGFLTAITLLATFIILTLFDTLTRGDVDPDQAEKQVPAVFYQKAAPDSSRTDSLGAMVADSLAPTYDSTLSDSAEH